MIARALQPTPIRWSWMPSVIAIASLLPLGIVAAQPPAPKASAQAPAPQTDDQLWQIAADELGVQIRQFEQHLNWMRKWAAFRKDTKTVAAVEAIQKKLALAKENHRELCRLCEERLHDTPSAITCCQKIDDVMYEVIEDHVALMQRLRPHRQRHEK